MTTPRSPLMIDQFLSPWQAGQFRGPDGSLLIEPLCEALGIPRLERLDTLSPLPEFVQLIPIAFARSKGMLGVMHPTHGPTLVIADLTHRAHCDTVIRILRTPLRIALADPELLQAAINSAYEQLGSQTSQTLASLDGQGTESGGLGVTVREDLLDSGEREPVVKLVNSLLFEAVTSQASDVHVQPDETHVLVRYRIDGILHDVHSIPKALQNELLSRIKVIGQMNIAEKRLSQDGRATVEVGNRSIDLRLASMPTNHGERIVIRLLEKDSRIETLSQLGMSDDHVTQLRRLIQFEHGMLLVTGPTGSGKSTTLYSALRELNTRDRNVVTLEDPIEYQLEGISQTQINTKKGMTFASGLRSILRQDPDVIMVGEIRDNETAMMAIQSALTGHLVFSTLHTNDAASAVTRLMDLGIEPYLVASSLLGVLAQRLVRKNCPLCTSHYSPTSEELRAVGLEEPATGTFAKGTGCDQCRHIGFKGRFAISELLIANESIRDQIHTHASAAQITRTATQLGMQPMRESGIEKATQGLTTLAEVARVTVSIG
ncbi:MAG: type II secretion system protein GspE [Planctomycetota bacterium]|nr:MAG: type II secretion system protein GspE [Planctomycetota bacterium]